MMMMRMMVGTVVALLLGAGGANAVEKPLVFDASVGDLARLATSAQGASKHRGDADIDAILANMTLREKIAQMTQLDIYSMLNGDCRDPETALNGTTTELYARLGIGSILNAPFGAPTDGRTGWSAAEWTTILNQIKDIYRKYSKTPMIYGIDTIHGATYVRGATLFGQPLSAATSFDLDLVHRMGQIEAKDTLAAGIPWVFSPVLGIAVQPKWSRVYETFGEDPYLASQMGASIIRGIQSSGRVAACMKHFVGYSNPIDGLDRADNLISDWDLVNYFAPSFLAATQAGVKTAMETYISINGFPVIASHKILTDLLRNDMNFTGMLVSDYSEIDRMFFEHHLVPSVDDAVRVSLTETSLDMNMGPRYNDFFATVERLVEHGELLESRLDVSVQRILELKRDLGLFQPHFDTEFQSTAEPNDDSVGSKEDQEVALKLARQSIVLLENKDNTLPLQLTSNETTTVFLTGPISDNKGYMCGGWSVFWPGSSNSSHFPNGRTLKEALLDRISEGDSVVLEHMEVVDVDGHYDKQDWEKAIEIAKRSKYTIVVLGEGNYAEKMGDIGDLTLPKGQRQYLKALSKIETTTVVLVVVAGRPRTLQYAHEGAKAVLASFLPCEQGGQALAEVLLGEVNPSGKLPITYPKHSGNTMPYFHRVNTVCDDWKDCEVQWPFGYGLSYTEFTYSDLRVNATKLGVSDSLQVDVTVKNSGPRTGSEAVLLYISQKYRLASVPETKMLKRFQKITLLPGEARHLSFMLTRADWGYFKPQIGHGFHREVEGGEYVVSVDQSVPETADRSVTHADILLIDDRDGPHPSRPTEPRRSHFRTLTQSFFIAT